ncbi:hypothetical protein [Duganella radicis]|uniref:Ribbon-helix-helix protein, CopG family n=1 Tax=Duganella radicis TaxID=551988 RepID=A0A6L6PKD3_9BURK|nr:hypothetical protein [Duganella radicis]MTV39568.1 hypothetical protein [Duganella radicis]
MEITQVIVNLPSEQVEFLERVARKERLTFTDILRRAIDFLRPVYGGTKSK